MSFDAHSVSMAPAGGPPGPDAVLDCRGQRCPLPVIGLARLIGQVPTGHVVRVIADDPAATTDIPAWCRMRGQQFLGSRTVGDGACAFDVRKAR